MVFTLIGGPNDGEVIELPENKGMFPDVLKTVSHPKPPSYQLYDNITLMETSDYKLIVYRHDHDRVTRYEKKK